MLASTKHRSQVQVTALLINDMFKIYITLSLLNLPNNSSTQDGYLMEAQQYAQETDLSRRVRNWEDRILPVLSEEVSQYKLQIESRDIQVS